MNFCDVRRRTLCAVRSLIWNNDTAQRIGPRVHCGDLVASKTGSVRQYWYLRRETGAPAHCGFPAHTPLQAMHCPRVHPEELDISHISRPLKVPPFQLELTGHLSCPPRSCGTLRIDSPGPPFEWQVRGLGSARSFVPSIQVGRRPPK